MSNGQALDLSAGMESSFAFPEPLYGLAKNFKNISIFVKERGDVCQK
jgi:hypothetical protein